MNHGQLGYSSPLQSLRYIERWDPDLPPDDPHPYNDEFSSRDLLGWQFAYGNSTGAGFEQNRPMLIIKEAGLFRPVPTSGDFMAWTKVHITGRPTLTNFGYAGMFVQVGTGTLWTFNFLVKNNATSIEHIKWNNWLTWDSTPSKWEMYFRNTLYFKIGRTGNTIVFAISTNGVAYYRLKTENLNNVDRIGIVAFSNSQGFFEFFRFQNGYQDERAILPGNMKKVFY